MERERAVREFEAVVAAKSGLELEILADRHRLGADVAVAPAALAVDAAVGPHQLDARGNGVRLGPHDQSVGLVQRQHREMHHAATAEQRIADFIKHLSGPVTRNHAGRLVKPLRAGGGAQPQAQVAAATRQVERELGPVTGIDTEGRVPAVERAVEKLRAVFDDEIGAVRPVAQRARDPIHQVRRDHRRAERLRLEQSGGTGGHGCKQNQDARGVEGRFAHGMQKAVTNYAGFSKRLRSLKTGKARSGERALLFSRVGAQPLSLSSLALSRIFRSCK